MNITYKPVITSNGFHCVEYHPELDTEESKEEVLQRIQAVVFQHLKLTREQLWSLDYAYKELEKTVRVIQSQHIGYNPIQHLSPDQMATECRDLQKVLKAHKYGYRGIDATKAESYISNLLKSIKLIYNLSLSGSALEEALERFLEEGNRTEQLKALKTAAEKMLYRFDAPEGTDNVHSNIILWLTDYSDTSQKDKNYLLQISVIEGRVDAVKALLQQGFNPNAKIERSRKFPSRHRVQDDDTFLTLAERTRRYHEKKSDQIINSLLNHQAVANITELRRRRMDRLLDLIEGRDPTPAATGLVWADAAVQVEDLSD